MNDGVARQLELLRRGLPMSQTLYKRCAHLRPSGVCDEDFSGRVDLDLQTTELHCGPKPKDGSVMNAARKILDAFPLIARGFSKAYDCYARALELRPFDPEE